MQKKVQNHLDFPRMSFYTSVFSLKISAISAIFCMILKMPLIKLFLRISLHACFRGIFLAVTLDENINRLSEPATNSVGYFGRFREMFNVFIFCDELEKLRRVETEKQAWGV